MILNPKNLFLGLITALIFMGCSQDNQKISKQENNEFETQVIYGQDNRRDWYEANSSYVDLAKSTVALFYSSDLREGNNSVGIKTSNPGWCANEPFQNQGTGAFCSGFLVGPDLVVTAGHCVRSMSSCSRTKFVFGFALKNRSHDFKTVAKDDVYACSEIIAREQEARGADFAVVRLDRKVTNYQPLPIRRSGSVSRGEDLVVIGHPSGLPSKIADGAHVRSIASSYFVTNLDTYGGNSGSAVFNAKTGDVEGILVRGDTDFVYRNGCYRSNVCSENGCRGEDVTKISNVLNYVPELSNQTPNPNPGDDAEEPKPNFYQEVASNASIPDNTQNGLVSYLDVNEAVAGRDVLVHLDISHPYIGDLVVGVIAPSGEVVRLRNRQGGNQSNLFGTYGDDLIATESLSDLQQEEAGEWRLFVVDLAFLDAGVLKSWALEFK